MLNGIKIFVRYSLGALFIRGRPSKQPNALKRRITSFIETEWFVTFCI